MQRSLKADSFVRLIFIGDVIVMKIEGKRLILRNWEDGDIEDVNGEGKRKNKKTKTMEKYEENDDGEEKIVRVIIPVKYRVISEESDNGQMLYTLIIHSPIQESNAFLTLVPVGETEEKKCNVHIQMSSIGEISDNRISKVSLKEGKNIIKFKVDNAGEYSFSLLAEHEIKIIE